MRQLSWKELRTLAPLKKENVCFQNEKGKVIYDDKGDSFIIITNSDKERFSKERFEALVNRSKSDDEF